jgi:predicted nucleotidyltransferase
MNNRIFSKGKEKILRFFYANRNKSAYFSEILRSTKSTPNTTFRHLTALVANNLLTSKKSIANTHYQINSKNPEIYALFSYFDYGRIKELPVKRQRAIFEFLERIQIKPVIVVLFGSTAKGDFSDESDIDLLVIHNSKQEETQIKKDIEAITGITIQTINVDLNYFKEQLMKKEDSVLMHAIKTGIPIVGTYFFYNKVLNDQANMGIVD